MSYRYWKAKIDGFIKQIWSKEVILTSAKSSWPGGQNVNKNETKIQLSRDVKNSQILPKLYIERLMERNTDSVTSEWVIRIDTSVHKSQKANKDQTLKKITKVIKSAFKEEKVRKKTTAPKWAVDKRIAEKKRRSKTRSSRTKIVG
jgi:ribosome-associated protein